MKYKILSIFSIFSGFINKGHDRSVKTKKNILASFVIKGCSIGINLLLVPLTIHYVDATQYGIWLTLSSIISWFSFFDIGFGNGLRNKFAEAVAKGEHENARTYVSTTYAILTIIIILVLTLFFCINPFLNWAKILNTPSELGSELRLLALIVFVFFCLQFVLQLIATVMTANQQPARASFFNFLGSLFSLGIIFILIKTTSGNLLYLGTALSVTPVLVLTISSVWYYKHEYKRYAPSIKYVKFKFAGDLMGLGLKFFVIQIAVLVLFQSSNIIIAQLFGPAQVTPYNIAYKYFSIIPMTCAIFIVPVWSAFTEAWIKQDLVWIRNIMARLKKMWILLLILTLLMLLFSDFVYRIWISSEISVPINISVMMAAYVIINAWNSIYSHFLNGVGKIKLQYYSGIWAIALNIPLAVFLGKSMGIPGVILSSVLLGCINMIWSVIQYNKIINKTAKGIWAA